MRRKRSGVAAVREKIGSRIRLDLWLIVHVLPTRGDKEANGDAEE
jgi:hypothetical protein